MMTLARDESDYDSSCSSITVPDSGRSWMSNLSFGSRRSSISYCSSTDTYFSNSYKPHKANQVAWEVMKRLQAQKMGRVGLHHFRLLRRLGSGDIGNVYLCQIRNPMVGLPQCFYAMKVVDREALAMRKKLQRAEMEKEILGMLDHPFLPTLYAEFDASHYSCFVMEFCPGGDLHASRQRQTGKRFTISAAKFYAAEVLLALEYLHMMGVVYRDLKPENVLVRDDGHIMLSDFDLAFKCDFVPKLIRSKPDPQPTDNKSLIKSSTSTTSVPYSCVIIPMPQCVIPMQPVLSCFSKKTKTTTITEQAGDTTTVAKYSPSVPEYSPELVAEPVDARSKSFVGTHEYLAPEVISGQGHGSAVDWWTFGVFLYELLYGVTPFKGENNEKTLINILKKPLSFPRMGFSSKKEYGEMVKFEDLIRKLLVKNPKKRIGALNGSVDIKRHDFFSGVNWALIRSVRPPEVPNDIVMKNRGARAAAAAAVLPKLSKKEREDAYQIPHHFEYF